MIVLTYHTVQNVKNFNAQIEYLSKHFVILNARQFSLLIQEGAPVNNREVLVTFDDGDYSVFEKALPVLIEYHCPAVLFIVSELIGTNRPFWWDEILKYTGSSKQVTMAKSLENSKRLSLLQALRSTHPRVDYRQLSTEELKVLEGSDVAIGSHSHSHPLLDHCSDDEIRMEFRASREFFDKHGLSGYKFFAYPNGNYSARTEKILKEEGIEYAFLFDHKVNKRPINPYRISRLSVNDDTPLWKFKLIINGWHSRLVPITKAIHRLVS